MSGTMENEPSASTPVDQETPREAQSDSPVASSEPTPSATASEFEAASNAAAITPVEPAAAARTDTDETAADAEEAEAVEEAGARVRRSLPRVIAVANQKGGVGKTTSTVNISACLAEQGFRTLLVDLDPQANASTGLGLDPRTLEHSIYHVMLHDVDADSCIEPTEVKNLFVLPSSLDLAGAEIELVPAMSREHRLRLAIESVIDDYDYVLIDCPPSLGLLTVNALTAATEVLVPIQCEYYALEGLGQLMRNVELVKANLNRELEISHIVLVMFDPRTKLAGQVVDEVRGHFGDRVCENVIPRTVRLSEAPSFGQPITTFDSESRGASAYRSVTLEVIDG
jgi:chromosome partitioning protein